MNMAPFPYRLAACDLDGTLLGPRKEISAANFAAVRQLRDGGVRFVVASGRRHQNSVRFYRQLNLDGLMISCSGALVKDPLTDRTLREVLIPDDLADALVAQGIGGEFTVIYYHRDHLFANARTHWTELYESRVGERAEIYPGDLREMRGALAQKIVWYGEPQTLKSLRPRLQEEYRNQIAIVSTDSENLEFLAPAANKADALAAVAEFYDVKEADTLAFGDGENDAPMLRWAGLGVAVDGADETARDAARLIGPAGAPEERFARALLAAHAAR